MSEQCLELKNVCKSFRDFTLNNISFTLPQGYIMGLVGPNGAGKTTTIQLILNMLETDTGEILVFGKDNVASEKDIKQDIGIVFDSIFYVDSWTVKDTEKAVSIFYNDWRHDIFNDMVKRFDLPQNKKVGELSRGMQMKLMLACAFSHNAKLLILDEPTAGLDVIARDELLEMLREFLEKDEERSILISSHISSDLESLCDDLYMIHDGKIIPHEDTDVLLSDYALLKVDAEQYSKLDKQFILRSKKETYGYSCLTNQKQYYMENYPKIAIEKGTIDEVITMMIRGTEQ